VIKPSFGKENQENDCQVILSGSLQLSFDVILSMFHKDS
jgi:hypothetical protein